jgi:hypothetical protein
MGKHLSKRERAAGKRKKRSHYYGWSNSNGSGSLTLKLGKRKWSKVNLSKISNAPF